MSESFPIHRAEMVDVRLALPVLAGSIKNARRLNTALGLPNAAALDQLDLDREDLSARMAAEQDDTKAGCRMPAALRRTLRIACGLQLGRLAKAAEAEEELHLDTAAAVKRTKALEALVRRLEDQLDALEHEGETDDER